MTDTGELKPIRPGGLMRCCIATLAEHRGSEDEGTVLACNYCSDSMRVRDGAWEWNRQPALARSTPEQEQPE